MPIKIYKYTLKDFDKIISIEANNRIEAREYLNIVLAQIQGGENHPVINEKIETPVSGITERKKDGKDYIWYSNGINEGWLLKSEYQKLFNK